MTGPEAAQLARIVRSLVGFRIVPDTTYDHMGAVITDSMLQAGLNYNAVVRPRVEAVMNRPEARTTGGFLKLLEDKGAGRILNWSHEEKIFRVVNLARFFAIEQVETVDDLRAWLRKPGSRERLKVNRGVGDKTADYICNLVGFSTAAVDRHLFNFLAEAGIQTSSYEQAQSVIAGAAQMLGIPTRDLDHSIWLYMSKRP